MKKTKFFLFLNRLFYSILFLWMALVFLSFFNLKPDLKINLFFFLLIILFMIAFYKEILVFLILALNRINVLFGSDKELSEVQLVKTLSLAPILKMQFLKSIKKLPQIVIAASNNRFFWFTLLMIFVLLDIFILNTTSSLLILILVILYAFLIFYFKIKGEIFIRTAFLFLILCPFLLSSGNEPAAEKVGIWAYVFLSIGIIQIVFKYIKMGKRNAKNKEK